MMDSVYLAYPYQSLGKIKNKQLHADSESIHDITVMLNEVTISHVCCISTYSGFSGSLFHVFFRYEMGYLVVSKKKNPLFE